MRRKQVLLAELKKDLENFLEYFVLENDHDEKIKQNLKKEVKELNKKIEQFCEENNCTKEQALKRIVEGGSRGAK